MAWDRMPNSCYQSSYNKGFTGNLGKARNRAPSISRERPCDGKHPRLWVNPLYRRQPCLYIRIKLYDNI